MVKIIMELEIIFKKIMNLEWLVLKFRKSSLKYLAI